MAKLSKNATGVASPSAPFLFASAEKFARTRHRVMAGAATSAAHSETCSDVSSNAAATNDSADAADAESEHADEQSHAAANARSDASRVSGQNDDDDDDDASSFSVYVA